VEVVVPLSAKVRFSSSSICVGCLLSSTMSIVVVLTVSLLVLSLLELERGHDRSSLSYKSADSEQAGWLQQFPVFHLVTSFVFDCCGFKSVVILRVIVDFFEEIFLDGSSAGSIELRELAGGSATPVAKSIPSLLRSVTVLVDPLPMQSIVFSTQLCPVVLADHPQHPHKLVATQPHLGHRSSNSTLDCGRKAENPYKKGKEEKFSCHFTPLPSCPTTSPSLL